MAKVEGEANRRMRKYEPAKVPVYVRKADERVIAEYRRSIPCAAASMDSLVKVHVFWRDT
jgi:hypothetical protein